jgi:hypothetical protein
MRQIETVPQLGEIPPELIDLVLDEAERALLLADARVDEPGRRLLTGDPPDDDGAPYGVPELRLAVAELIDAHPGIQQELERISDRIRTLGPVAAAQELSSQPHLLDLVRLSIETFFRMYPDLETYEMELESRGADPDDLGRTPADTYRALSELRGSLRSRMN